MPPALAFAEQFQPANVGAAAAREAERALPRLAKRDGPGQVQSVEVKNGRREAALLSRAGWDRKLENMSETLTDADKMQNRVIEQIVELQREFYFENRGKESERRRRLREIIDRATGAQGDE